MKWSGMLLVVLCCACGDDEDTSAPAPADPEAFMDDYFVVFDRRVIDDIMALYEADVTADISGIGALEGADEVRDQWLLPFTSAFPDYEHEVEAMSVAERRVTADFVFSGTHQGTLLGYEPTGRELALPITGTYDISDDAVASFTLEYDINIVLAAITP